MKIFVYGSLKTNKNLHFYLKNAKFLGYAKTAKRYPLIISKSGWYPYLLNCPGKGFFVKGEIYEIDYNLLKRLDRLEEVPHYYKRKLINVKFNGKTIKAYTYFYAKNKKYLNKDLLEEF
ncbi:gamma-glutamylcyclotransferase family protein [Nautilia lithotrophica]